MSSSVPFLAASFSQYLFTSTWSRWLINYLTELSGSNNSEIKLRESEILML
jgi:hypothetical protein